MNNDEYVGKLYLPIIATEPWNKTKTYEPHTIVEHENGNSYTSRKSVPADIDISNEDYWAETGNHTRIFNSILAEEPTGGGNPNVFKTFKGKYNVTLQKGVTATSTVCMLSCTNQVSIVGQFSSPFNGFPTVLFKLPDECKLNGSTSIRFIVPIDEFDTTGTQVGRHPCVLRVYQDTVDLLLLNDIPYKYHGTLTLYSIPEFTINRNIYS